MSPKVFLKPDGSYSPHPPTKQDAISLQRPKYDDGTICPVCSACSIRYTANDRCAHCAVIEAMHFFNRVVLGVEWPAELQVTADMQTAYEAFPMAGVRPHPGDPAAAQAAKSPIWVRLEPCSKAGHLGVRMINGGCWFCSRESKPRDPARAMARNAGATWYTPTVPCPKCGTLADRQVQTDRCSHCQPAQRGPGALGAVIMMEAPDLILSRFDAQTLGYSVYRTGEACPAGHTGWRYVSTGACVDCSQGVG